jgi:hypothetical protein
MASQVDILIRAIGGEAAANVIGQVRTALGSIQTAWNGVAGALAAAGVTAALREMWTAAEESRVAQFQLRAALEASGQASREAAAALMDQANALQGLTGTSDEAVMSVQRVLLAMGATADQVAQLTPLVLDVAAAMGTDAVTAARQLGQALDGQDLQLGRLNIKAKSFEELLGILNQRFRGQAAALMEARGPMAGLAISAGELQETLGGLLAWSASPFLSELARIASAFERINSVSIGQGTIAFLSMLAAQSPSVQTFRSMATTAQGLASGVEAAQGLAGIWNLPSTIPSSLSSSRTAGLQRGGGSGGFDLEAASIEGERARQATAAQELLRVEAELNNLYGFRRSLIEQDPTMSDPERRSALVGVMRDELPVLQQREELLRAEFERQRQADPNITLETTIEAESRLQQAQLERLRITEEITAAENNDTFRGQMTRRVNELADAYRNMAVVMANVTFDTVVAGVQGLSSALTSIIMGTKSAGQAFAEFGLNLLTNFIQTILSAVIYAKVAIPILTALGVVSGGATAATGAGVTTAALAAGSAAAASASGGFAAGGYTGDGPVWEKAGDAHRGEWIVPAWRTAEIGVPALEQMTFGDSGGGSQGIVIRPIVVNDQRSAERLMRDPNFISFIMDLRDS